MYLTFFFNSDVELSKLTSLKHFSVDSLLLAMDFPSNLLKLTQLTHLQLRNVGIRGDVPPLNQLSLLQHLDLSENFVKSMPNLSYLQSLTFLNVSTNALAGNTPDLPPSIQQWFDKKNNSHLSHT